MAPCGEISSWNGTKKNLGKMSLSQWPHFENKKISRRLPAEGEGQLEYLVSTNNGDWVQGSTDEFLICQNSSAVFINDICFCRRNILIGDILTVYDITSGDETMHEEFHGIDNQIVARALAHLQSQGRAQIMREEGKPIDEWGVKFLAQ